MQHKNYYRIILIFVFTWSVHYEKLLFVNSKNLLDQQSNKYNERNDSTLPSGISVFLYSNFLLFIPQNAFARRIL